MGGGFFLLEARFREENLYFTWEVVVRKEGRKEWKKRREERSSKDYPSCGSLFSPRPRDCRRSSSRAERFFRRGDFLSLFSLQSVAQRI